MAEVGEVIMWAGAPGNPPPGFLYCDGTQVGQSDYPELYAVTGNSFGASPSPGNFYLPDLRGRFIRGVDDGAGRDPDVGSRTDMENTSVAYSGVGSIQPDAFRTHAHLFTGIINNQESLAAGSDYGGGTTPTMPAGGNETRPINAYLYFLICCKSSGGASR